jgi:hypothetical protein
MMIAPAARAIGITLSRHSSSGSILGLNDIGHRAR